MFSSTSTSVTRLTTAAPSTIRIRIAGMANTVWNATAADSVGTSSRLNSRKRSSPTRLTSAVDRQLTGFLFSAARIAAIVVAWFISAPLTRWAWTHRCVRRRVCHSAWHMPTRDRSHRVMAPRSFPDDRRRCRVPGSSRGVLPRRGVGVSGGSSGTEPGVGESRRALLPELAILALAALCTGGWLVLYHWYSISGHWDINAFAFANLRGDDGETALSSALRWTEAIFLGFGLAYALGWLLIARLRRLGPLGKAGIVLAGLGPGAVNVALFPVGA